MKDSLQAGLEGVRKFEIDRERTISFMGDELRVYGTPYMVRDIEETSRILVQQHLDEGEETVGAHVSVDHLGASLIGMTATVTAKITGVAALEEAFYDVHERRFGHRSDAATEVVTFRVAAIGRVDKPTLPGWTVTGELADARIGGRAVYFGGWHDDVPVYDRARLPLEREVVGPAVIEESGSTPVLPPGWRCHVLSTGDIFMERR